MLRPPFGQPPPHVAQLGEGIGLATSPAYDANGNLTTDETNRDCVYDAWNRLVKVKDTGNNEIARYTYDALGRRITEDVKRTGSFEFRHFYYSPAEQVLEERQGTETTADKQYVWSPGYVDALVQRDWDFNGTNDNVLEAHAYVMQDANFNVTGFVGTAGGVQERYFTDPYGGGIKYYDANMVERTGGSVHDWKHLHQGLRYEAVTGLYWNRARDYSPTLMRFIQNDDAMRDGTNLYAAYGNGPVNGVDPLGHEVRLYKSPTAAPGFGHVTIVVWDRCADTYYTFDGNGPGGLNPTGSLGSPIVYGFLQPKERGPITIPQGRGSSTTNDPLKGPWPDLYGNGYGPYYKTGLSFKEELAALERVAGVLKQPLEYRALGGPNSNTYARQLLLLAFGYAPLAPKYANGWDYSGPYQYGGDYYDKYGNPKRKYITMLENRIAAFQAHLDAMNLFADPTRQSGLNALKFMEGHLAYAKKNESWVGMNR